MSSSCAAPCSRGRFLLAQLQAKLKASKPSLLSLLLLSLLLLSLLLLSLLRTLLRSLPVLPVGCASDWSGRLAPRPHQQDVDGCSRWMEDVQGS